MKITDKNGKKIEFKPLENKVKMYVCGPTVYDRIHIGNIRSVIIYDLFYRTLIYKYGKENVIYARNITDIDDKIINKAKETNSNPEEIAKKYSEKFISDYKRMNCLTPTHEIYATKELSGMINYIEELEKTGVTYRNKDGILIDVGKVSTYNQLSGRKFSENKSTISEDKKNNEDFYLWKFFDKNDFGYETKIGYGRPGWHTECAFMSTKYLGKSFDIHGGGIDLKFPHHENERCQAICVNQDEKSFAKHYLHHEMLYIDGKKMSKSLGNVINIDTISDYFNIKLSDKEIRFILMSKHYRKRLDLDLKMITELKNTLNKIEETLNDDYNKKLYSFSESSQIPKEAIDFLYDDFNIHGYISVMIKYCNLIKKSNNDKDRKQLLEGLSSMHYFPASK